MVKDMRRSEKDNEQTTRGTMSGAVATATIAGRPCTVERKEEERREEGRERHALRRAQHSGEVMGAEGKKGDGGSSEDPGLLYPAGPINGRHELVTGPRL